MTGSTLIRDRRQVWRSLAVYFTCFIAVAALGASDLSVFATQFFNLNNTWYTKIPANPTLRAGSASYVNFIVSVSPVLNVSNTDWSVPVWYADASTPTYDLTVTDQSTLVRNTIFTNGWHLNVPIPNEARSAAYGKSGYYDRHMVVVRRDLNKAWDFFQYNADTKTTQRVKVWSLNSDGVAQPFDQELNGGNCRVSPVPLLHGLITYEEIQRGYIDHAIAFATYAAKSGSPGVYPLVGPNSGQSTDTWAPWLGMRFQLDPSLDLNALNLSAAGKVIAKALQEYGMIFVENNGPGNNSIYAESLAFKTEVSWGSLLSPSSASGIPLNRLRLVEPIYPSWSTPAQPAPSNLRIVE